MNPITRTNYRISTAKPNKALALIKAAKEQGFTVVVATRINFLIIEVK